MSEGHPCVECGTPLSTEPWSKGLCPHCLLELAVQGSSQDSLDGEETREFAPGPEAELSPGRILGHRYQIRSRLGHGGMGEVWRAFDLKLRVEVALKALRSDLLHDQRAQDLLRREVRSAREVISPNVCRIYDLVVEDGQELISMEHIDGITLLELLATKGPLELREAGAIAAQFLAGLEAIHLAGLVHRDLKPENVMITRAGRVVVMDFGIAKQAAGARTGTISGTKAYMAPEQARGEVVDARADVFSAGVVLAEMISAAGIHERESRESLWAEIRHVPPKLPDSPWHPVLLRALAQQKADRYGSAQALARALEEITLRVEGVEDKTPYPGLASFTEADAQFFFGREAEVEAMVRKLRRPHMLAVIGPSGAGKSSFLRAGLLEVLRESWGSLICTPGAQPFKALAQALGPKPSGDAGAMKELLDFDQPDVAVSVVRRWRQRHEQALLVLDQFEELFTLNPPEVQERFAALLGRLAIEADVHVLLSMRDDFLFHCAEQPALAPIFTELTPLRPPVGTALRRALVQPALQCGYRFEDDALVDEMVGEVSDERGALPLLAFAAARLWDRRDRESGLLTRSAYRKIGGVAGALSQHAEATLERIGSERIPVVRELLRTLVTAQGTRAARDREELLSIFDATSDSALRTPKGGSAAVDRQVGEQVLDTLIQARLLTAFELPPAEGERSGQQRVEIVHESLLSSWPRLVRWQTQDADSAQLRDQLHQAAALWEQRGQPDDLLWSRTSFKEYSVWRERYPGRLTATEEAYCQAMEKQAERSKRRRRRLAATGFTVLVVALALFGALWRRAEQARGQAVMEARRAEANQLLTLGRLELERNATAAVAYALASLELSDNPAARLLALEALWRGPAALVLEGTSEQPATMNWTVDFSPNGHWLAVGDHSGRLKLWSRRGGEPKLLGTRPGAMRYVRFGPDSDVIVTRSVPPQTIRWWTVPGGRVIRTLPFETPLDLRLLQKPRRLITFTHHGRHTEVQSWPLAGGESESLGQIVGLENPTNIHEWDLDVKGDGANLAYVPFTPGTQASSGAGNGREVLVVPLSALGSDSARRLGQHSDFTYPVAFDPSGRRLASADEGGEVRIWSLAARSEALLRTLRQPPGWVRTLRFDRSGSKLAAASLNGAVAAWDLEGPPGADPILLRRGEASHANDAAFDPQGRWLATASYLGVSMWPMERRYPLVLRGHKKQVVSVIFSPSGDWLASAAEDSTVRLWSFKAGTEDRSGIVFEEPGAALYELAVDPAGERLLVGPSHGRVWLVPLRGGRPRELRGFSSIITAVAFGPRGRRVAAAGGRFDPREAVIRVWDLESGAVRVLDRGDGKAIEELVFTPDGRLISAGDGGVFIWQLETGGCRSLRTGRAAAMAASRDGRFLLTGGEQDHERGEAVLYDLERNTSRRLDWFGQAGRVALDPSGRIAAVAGFFGRGPARVGPVSGETPHLLVGPDSFQRLAVSPDGKWVASTTLNDNAIHLWPVPQGQPFHTLPYAELLDRLRALTNLRAVRDQASSAGYRIELGPFPGWEKAPTW